MKKVVVIYKSDDWDKKIPLETAIPTRESFEDWHERGLKSGIAMYRASIQWYDLPKGVFKKAWAYRNRKWIKVKKPISPDLVFDKIAGKYGFELFALKQEISKKVKIFNSPLFRTLLDSKLSQYLIFKEFMPNSFLAYSKKELKSIIKKIKSSKVVIKPLYGSGGFGIQIKRKSKINYRLISYPVLVQEFVSAKKGVPGFTKKSALADLRLVFMNHKLIYALSRIAKKGSLFTNFHQGAKAVLVPRKYIPATALRTARKITDRIKIFPEANYSIDFLFTDLGEPVLVEINTTPGFDLLRIVGDEKTKEKNFKEFIKVIP